MTGLGGWGDANDDFAVHDGGFSQLLRSYPSLHTLRRNFTLYPYNNSNPFFTDQLQQGNASLLQPGIEAILETSAGDFKDFQKALEAFEVGTWTGLIFSSSCLIPM